MSSRPALPEVGALVAGKYRVLGVLGRGGMGIVYEAHHELLERRVALKVLAPEVVGNQEAVTRFMNEARAAARITSDRVVQVLDVGLLEGALPYMVMERLEGVDLGHLVATHSTQGEMRISEVVDLLLEAIEGVAHAHLEGIIHRDLKPSNLFLARRPDRTSIVKVLDFGISKLTGPGAAQSGSVTSTSAILGSPLYMSPEQLRSSKTIDQRADVWSFGVIAYEMLTGTLPFEGDNLVEIFAAIQERNVRPMASIRADIPPGLDEVIARCLRRVADERFSSMYSVGKALLPFGGPRAQESITRLEGHISSKGRTVHELTSTQPSNSSLAAARAAADHGLGAASSSGAPALGFGSNPPLASGANAVTPPPLALAPGEATSAPWSNTGRSTLRPATVVSAGAIGLVSIALVAGGAFFVMHSLRGGNGGASAANGLAPDSAMPVVVATASDVTTAPPLAVESALPDAAMAATAAMATNAPDASSADAMARVASDTTPPPPPLPSPKPASKRTGTPAPPPPAADRPPAKPAANPLNMKTF